MAYTTNELSEEQSTKLQILFPDTFGIAEFFKLVGLSLSSKELESLYDKSSGDVYKLELNFTNVCKMLFRYTDKNGDGFITAQEMQLLLGKILGGHAEVTVEEATYLIAAVAENGDGQLDFQEFVAMLVKTANWKNNISNNN